VTGDAKTEVEGRLRDVGGKVEGIVGQAKDVAGQATGYVQDVADRAGSYASDALDRGNRLVEEGRRRYPDAERYYRGGSEAVRSQVSESPLAALLIAGAVGYGVAWLLHHRS
jgi:ElaB/YqjD/DUF883 family membrane-anchored ribosome-binding protein